MSNLLNAEQNPPFGWAYAWTPLDDDGIPKIDVSAALKQPKTTRVRWDTVPARGANARELSADVVPDKGLLGPEFALIFTIPQFEKKIRARLDSGATSFVSDLYSRFADCLQDVALTNWNDAASKVE